MGRARSGPEPVVTQMRQFRRAVTGPPADLAEAVRTCVSFGFLGIQFGWGAYPNASLQMAVAGGVSLIIAALFLLRGDGDTEVIEADEHEPYTIQESVQSVPSTGLMDR